MITILGVSGSLRAQSYNTALLRAAQQLASEQVNVQIATLVGIPLYDGDVEESDGIPAAVTALKQRILASDALLLATPEYNNGIPGVFKNAIDWLSRPPKETAGLFGDRPVAVIGASPGGFGTIMAQNAWLPVLKTLGTRQWSGQKVLVSRATQAFDGSGQLVDPIMRTQLQAFVAGFAAFAAEVRAARTG